MCVDFQFRGCCHDIVDVIVDLCRLNYFLRCLEVDGVCWSSFIWCLEVDGGIVLVVLNGGCLFNSMATDGLK